MKYLLKIEAMLGDADGSENALMVISEKEYHFFEKNKSREMGWGNEFLEGESTLEESVEAIELSDEEFKVLEKLGLTGFGQSSTMHLFFEEMDEDE